jgi:hypothetical protein
VCLATQLAHGDSWRYPYPALAARVLPSQVRSLVATPDQEILAFVIKTFVELTADRDVGEISAQTKLKSLRVRSMVLIYALADLQEHFGLHDEMFRKSLADGIPLDEHTVGDIARYMAEALRNHVS